MSISPASPWGTVPDFAELMSAEFWRERKLEVFYAGAAAMVFLVVLVATFPYAQTMRAVLEPMGLSLSSGSQHYSFPFGTRLDDVRLRAITRPHSPLLFEGKSVRIAPSILWTLLMRPGITSSASAYGGNLAVSAHRSGSGITLSFSANAVKVGEYPELRPFGFTIGGELTGAGALSLSTSDVSADSGKVDFDIKGLSVNSPGAGPAINLGDAHASLSLENGVLTIAELKNKGGDLSINGSGTVKLAPDLMASPLAMRLNLMPEPRARQKLQFLLGMLPHPPGMRPYVLKGTLGAPVFQ
jgi:type II secretion system protein N